MFLLLYIISFREGGENGGLSGFNMLSVKDNNIDNPHECEFVLNSLKLTGDFSLKFPVV